MTQELLDIETLLELAIEAKDDHELKQIELQLKSIQEKLQAVELKEVLSGEHDFNHALITITPGAGGTESQDWAQMLWRMVMRWAAFRSMAIHFLLRKK